MTKAIQMQILEAPIRIDRICSCGRYFKNMPTGARFMDDEKMPGWYFNCECKSTLFVPSHTEVCHE